MALDVLFDIDVSDLTPVVASLVKASSAERPDLDWHTHPARYAKDKLDRLEDTDLLGGSAPAGGSKMVSGLRALLYLWNGWPTEAAMFAPKAPDLERRYILGLRERQLGLADKAKATFEGLTHPIFPELRQAALAAMDQGTDPILVRYREFLNLYGKWEPKLFVDLVEAGRSDRLSEEAHAVARLIQVREFELLFRHCYQQATAQAIRRPQPEQPEDEMAQRKRIRKMRENRRREGGGGVAPSKAGSSDKSAPTAHVKPKDASADATPQHVTVGCPKCGHVGSYPGSARGKKAKCSECAAVFTLPSKPGASGQPSKPQGVTVSCPKCNERARAAEPDRGKKTQCAKCGATFVIPKK